MAGKRLAKLAKIYIKNHIDPEAGAIVAIGDADCPTDGDAFADKLRAEFPSLAVLRSTIGCHVGSGMVSCCFWGADRRG